MARINDVACILWTFLTVGMNLAAAALTAESSCSEVKRSYGAQGELNPNHVPQNVVPGTNLRICTGHRYTCCTPELEEKLVEQAETEFESKVREKTSLLRDFFIRRTQKFDDYMKQLIEISRRDLRNMFTSTYGRMYSENDEIFEELFDSLRDYYYGIDINLEQVMEDFFFVLFQRMFMLLNDGYEYNDQFWDCTGHYMEELHPFEGIPNQITLKVQRSVTGARTFVQGLGIGRDVVTDVSKVDPTPSCLEALTRMSECAACSGETRALPCYDYCQNVMKGCLSSEAEIQQEWNRYVDEMSQLADRLMGPFNVHSVLMSIDLDISNAIMNMQGHANTITQNVMSGCGPLPQKRQKRASDRGRDSGKRKSSSSNANLPDEPTVDLPKLLRDVKRKLPEWERIWLSLSYDVCNDATVATDTLADSCWNGSTVGGYNHAQVGIGISAQVDNPEVTVDPTKPNFMVRKQIAKLRTMTQQLKNAVAGKEADWIYSEYLIGSGSGSGSGSGDGSNGGDVVDMVDPKYRPTVPPPEQAGVSLSASWVCLLLLLLAAMTIRW